MSFTIDILNVQTYTNDLTGDETRTANIEIDNGSTGYAFAVGSLPTTGNVQTMLDNNAAEVWRLAVQQGDQINYLDRLSTRQLFKGLIEMIADEINILRALHSLPDRTPAQIKAALKAKLIEMQE